MKASKETKQNPETQDQVNQTKIQQRLVNQFLRARIAVADVLVKITDNMEIEDDTSKISLNELYRQLVKGLTLQEKVYLTNALSGKTDLRKREILKSGMSEVYNTLNEDRKSKFDGNRLD
jgi:hypothetical protein